MALEQSPPAEALLPGDFVDLILSGVAHYQ